MQLWAQFDPDCFTCVAASGGEEGFEACRTPRPPPPPPPAPVVVPVQIVTYTEAQAAAAASEVAAAFASPPPAPPDTPPPPPAPVVEITATVGFPIDIADIAEGSAERQSFEADFKASMAGSIGGGSAVSADKVVIDDITAGRRRLTTTDSRRRAQSSAVSVDFHIVVPEVVSTQATSLVAAVDTSSLTVGGVTATEISDPVVTATPDVDCIGAWDTCSATCADKIFRVTTVASGSGVACSAAHYDTMACARGDGDCGVVDCVGAWSECTADCSDKTFTVQIAPDGGTACDAEDGATETCAPGDGACPPAPPPATPTATPAPAPSTSSGSIVTVNAVAAMVAAAMLL